MFSFFMGLLVIISGEKENMAMTAKAMVAASAKATCIATVEAISDGNGDSQGNSLRKVMTADTHEGSSNWKWQQQSK